MNSLTPRVFIAATRQNDGKTTTSLGLLAALQRHYPRIGYIKPVGQRYVEIAEHKIDEDTVLMDSVYKLNCPLADMSPIAIEPEFTRKYLESANNDALVARLKQAFDRVAWEKDFVLCEGSGHAGVGSVFDISNARAAKILEAKVVIVTRGGIGKPIDEVALNQALFDQEGVEIVGVIINKVLPEKLDFIADFARRGLERRGLRLLGVLPNHPMLARPNILAVRDELKAELLNRPKRLNNLVDDVVVGAMAVHNALPFFKQGVLLITPGDREDLILAAATVMLKETGQTLSGIVLTGGLRPNDTVLKVIHELPYPVLLARNDSYQVASDVHDLIVKTRPDDLEKINIIRDLIARHVEVDALVQALK
jgi:BioD-like phosphotransacetylase family protein